MLLAEKTLDLEGAVSKCHSFEVADDGMNSISQKKLQNHTEVERVRASIKNLRMNEYQVQKECKFCLKKHKWGRNFCPAFGKACMACRKQNHFAGSEICHKRNDPPANEDSIDASLLANDMAVLFMGSVLASGSDTVGNKEGVVNRVEDKAEVKNLLKDFYVKLKVASNDEVIFKIDTGADVSIIKWEDLEKFSITKNNLRKSERSLNAAGGTKLNCVGYFVKKINFS